MGASAQWTLVPDVVTYYCSLRREGDAVKAHAEAKWAFSHTRTDGPKSTGCSRQLAEQRVQTRPASLSVHVPVWKTWLEM